MNLAQFILGELTVWTRIPFGRCIVCFAHTSKEESGLRLYDQKRSVVP
jgi:hypothetical protein